MGSGATVRCTGALTTCRNSAPETSQPANSKRKLCCAARYQVDSANRDFNAHNKAFGAARKVCMPDS